MAGEPSERAGNSAVALMQFPNCHHSPSQRITAHLRGYFVCIQKSVLLCVVSHSSQLTSTLMSARTMWASLAGGWASCSIDGVGGWGCSPQLLLVAGSNAFHKHSCPPEIPLHGDVNYFGFCKRWLLLLKVLCRYLQQSRGPTYTGPPTASTTQLHSQTTVL